MKLLTLLVVPLASSRVISTQQQIPIIGDVETKTDTTFQLHETTEKFTNEIANESEPKIGVHFTTSYAIASARYQNGTIRDLRKVLGNEEYIRLMSRWTNGEDDSNPACQNARSPECSSLAIERHEHCHTGLQTSHDVQLLSNFMKQVRVSIEQEVGSSVQNIAPVFPRLSTCLSNDVHSALTIAGLGPKRQHNELLLHDEANAAYTALGHGLCAPSTDCDERKKSRKSETVLYLNFDNLSFSVGAMSVKTAFDVRPTFSYGSDTKLGWWNLPVFPAPRARHWAKIHEMIAAVVAPMGRAPNKIILMGEHGADEEFKEVVKAAVWEVLEFDVEMMLGAVPKERVAHLVARGAAEMASMEEAPQRGE